MAEQAQTLFERAGGEAGVRQAIDEFVRRVASDLMIGFLFRNVDLKLLGDREYEFTANFLGAGQVQYSGRSLKEAHASHLIMGGQFDRRRQILLEVLDEQGIAADVRTGWLSHVDDLRNLIVRGGQGQCD